MARAAAGRHRAPLHELERGPLLETWILHELRTHLAWHNLGGELSYYRLSQTDLNGETRYYDMISVGCESTNGTAIVSTWDDGTNVNVL